MSFFQHCSIFGSLIGLQLLLLIFLNEKHWLWCVGSGTILAAFSLLILNWSGFKLPIFGSITYLVVASIVLIPLISFYFPWYSDQPAEFGMTMQQYANLYVRDLIIACIAGIAGSVACGLVMQAIS